MEYLLPALKNGSIVAPIKIRSIADHYDGSGFLTFPERKGWNTASWRWENQDKGYDRNGRGVQEMASFLQTWLYFGMLHVVLGAHNPRLSFTRTEFDGVRYLDTTLLSQYVELWRSYLAKLPAEERDAELDRCWECAVESQDICQGLTYHLSHDEIEDDVTLLEESVFVAHLLSLTLDTIQYQIRYGRSRVIPSKPDCFLRDSMLKAGWCRSTVDFMQDALPLQLQTLAFTLGSERTLDDHGGCSGGACKLNQVGSDYTMRHTRTQCSCLPVRVPIDEVVEILSKGMIPMIGVIEPNDSDTRRALRVHGVDLNDPEVQQFCAPYVAITHLWSDGFGNPHDNAILSCQLDRLAKILQGLDGTMASIAAEAFEMPEAADGSVAFWLDTLCIPVQPEHQSLRDFSISKMKQIYEKAAGVIVLDKDVKRIPDDASELELLIRVLSSGWRSRLWTYQEGQGNRNLHFPVRNKCITPQLNKVTIDVQSTDLIEQQLVYSASVRYQYLVQDILARGAVDPNHPEQKFVSIVRAACHRTTSRAGDETICIATFLGFDPTFLLRLPVEERMSRLLAAAPAISNIILFTRGPRLPQPGFRWAPRSLLFPFGTRDLAALAVTHSWYNPGLNGWCLRESDRGAVFQRLPLPYVDSNKPGLNVFFPAIRFDGRLFQNAEVFTVKTGDDDVYLVEHVDSGSRIPWTTPNGEPHVERFAILLTNLEYGKLCLLVALTHGDGHGQDKPQALWRSLVMVHKVGDFVENASLDVGMRDCFEGEYVPFRWWCLV